MLECLGRKCKSACEENSPKVDSWLGGSSQMLMKLWRLQGSWCALFQCETQQHCPCPMRCRRESAKCGLSVICWCAGRCTLRMPGRGEGRRRLASQPLWRPLRKARGEGRALGSWHSKSERCWTPGAARADGYPACMSGCMSAARTGGMAPSEEGGECVCHAPRCYADTPLIHPQGRGQTCAMRLSYGLLCLPALLLPV